MGKVTGFMDYERVEEDYAPVPERVKNYNEFVIALKEDEAKVQSARCMDCGTPFCNSGCPVNNIIPDFNDLVYRADWKNAFAVLDSTNNFPEFTGRICPAPCEAACTLNVNDDPVGIKSIEHAIIDRAWAEGWVVPRPPAIADRQDGRGRRLGPGRPRRRAAARARRPRRSRCSRSNDAIGGLLRYGIPDFKMEKSHIDRRDRADAGRGRRLSHRRADRRAAPSGEVVTDWSSESADADRADGASSTRCCWPPAPSARATCRCRAATSTASTTRWNSCRSRTRSTPATRSRARSAPTART